MGGGALTSNSPLIFQTAFTMAEVLITLGIIGIIAAITLSLIIPKFERVKNAQILKRAYGDLQIYVLDFIREKCELENLSNCCPSDGQFVTEFQKYLYDKQNFHLMNPKKTASSWVVFKDTKGQRNSLGQSIPFEVNNGSSSRYLGSPTGLYAFFISNFPYDNYYSVNSDKFRARIHIMTDMSYTGILKPSSLVQSEPNRKVPTPGKNMFEAFVLNSAKVIPNGTDLCVKSSYYCKSLKNTPCMTLDIKGSTTCLQQIINDSWQIKYYN